MWLLGVWLVIGLTTTSLVRLQAFGTYYVNARSGSDTNDGRSPTTAWRTIARANAVVRPGDTVIIYGGMYRGTIAPGRSGTDQMRIIYRAAPGETVILESADRLLELRGRSYITIEGMTFRNPIRNWGEIQDGYYNELIGNRFYGNGRGPRTSYSGLYLFDGSSYNRLINNVFQDWGERPTEWGDALALSWDANHTLIENNHFINAGHALLDVSTSYNLVRNNYFKNAWQKGIDLVWRVGPPWAPDQEFVARRNVIESNTFARCRIAADGRKGGAGIQLSAARTIFRRNLIIENEGGGIALNGWEPDAPRVYGNRIYHNTIVANGVVGRPETGGSLITQWGHTGVNLRDTVLKNNIFYRNAGETVQLFFNLYPSAQYGAAYFRSFQIAGNCISRAPTMSIRSLDGAQWLNYYQKRYPEFIAANLDAEPRFVNPAVGDYRLTIQSPGVDAGVPLTATTRGGSGQIVPVADASYFTDGYGLVPGDQVKVGLNPAVMVLSVDYTNNTLTVARAISWMQDDPVYEGEFSGGGPDMGAFEAGDLVLTSPMPPTPAIPVSYVSSMIKKRLGERK
jgi:hypothetical protein